MTRAASGDAERQSDPAAYDAWYETDRGRWIAGIELRLLKRLLAPRSGSNLLDVGCGTGHFTRGFGELGLDVTGLDNDLSALQFARGRSSARFVGGDARQLPFADRSFDHCIAVTSLCFVDDPARAVAEMWRVARHGIALGLLHRNSLLHRRKAGRGAYRGARWDRCGDARRWFSALPDAGAAVCRWAVFDPSGNPKARIIEHLLPASVPLGGFLAIAAHPLDVSASHPGKR
jgi:SAM-dependent methyltransferase